MTVTKNKIGYLIPEFPGQTHNFFWRERNALKELGIDPQLISTRRPPKGIISASWATEAQATTTYLFPLTISDILNSILMLLSAGPAAIYRCARAAIFANDMSPFQKIRLVLLIPFAAKLIFISKKQGWNHVHVHSCADAANISLFSSLLSDRTYSLTLHGHLYGYGNNQNQKWSHAKFALSITKTLYTELNKYIGQYLPEKIEIAPMGVDVDVFKRSTPYSPYTGTGELIIFTCGRLNSGKGYAHEIQAIKLLRDWGLTIKLVIAGEDEQGGTGYRKELEKLITANNLEDTVTLLGAVAEENIREHLEKAHLFVLASLNEGLSVVLMEAMAMSVPVIATQVGGLSELVDHGIDGILVPSGNAAVIAEAIRELASTPELATRFSKSSRQKIVDSFSHRRSAQVIARLLEPMWEK